MGGVPVRSLVDAGCKGKQEEETWGKTVNLSLRPSQTSIIATGFGINRETGVGSYGGKEEKSYGGAGEGGGGGHGRQGRI